MTQTTRLEGDYDYIIVGAGAAGCVLANRLSADGHARVLLLEAGGRDNWIWYHIPVGYLYAVGNPRSDWMFKTEPVPGLGGRVIDYPRGKVIGGSSSINAMIVMRGQAADYDHWRQLGLAGWGWDDVLPWFKRHEDHVLGAGAHHAKGGEWRVDAPRVHWDLLDAVTEAAGQIGIRRIPDFNTGDSEGVAPYHVNQKHGRRWSTARGFLKPALGRANLRLETGCQVERVLFEGRRAVGVRFRQGGAQGGEMRQARCRGEVILAAGAIGSVQTLLLSGVGPGAQLGRFGIAPVADRPGVGENLQDHLQVRLIYKVEGVKTLNTMYASLWGRARIGLDYALRRQGPMTMAPAQLGIVTRSDPGRARANLQYNLLALSLDRMGQPLHPFPAFTVSVSNVQPTSRGTVRLKSADFADAPAIQPNYLATDDDRKVAADSLRLARRLVAQPALEAFHPVEILPGPKVGDDDAALIKVAADIGSTIYHPVGTARMGLPSDPMAVVDERLRVFGVEGLRVVDASVMPTITSGNTSTPTVMIGEKGAAMIREDARKA